MRLKKYNTSITDKLPGQGQDLTFNLTWIAFGKFVIKDF